jgi:hypothetical protein
MEKERLESYYNEREEADITLTTMGTTISGVEREPEAQELRCQGIAIVPLPTEFRRSPMRKYYWATGPGVTMVWSGHSDFCIYGTSEEYLGFPGDTIAITVPWPDLWQSAEPEPATWRGIFNPTYDRKVLFSKEVTIKTADLRRWQPQIMIDRRILERENE